MSGLPERSSCASSLRARTALRAQLSFAFFVRAALGLRRYRRARLEALQKGLASATPGEAKLLELWRAYPQQVPAALAWAVAKEEAT